MGLNVDQSGPCKLGLPRPGCRHAGRDGRRGLPDSMLTHETNCNVIYCTVYSKAYAAVISNLYEYNSISKG